MSMVDSFEKIPVKIYPDLKQGSIAVAQQIAALIRDKQAKKEKAALRSGVGYGFYSKNAVCGAGENA